jgi:diguanylate cyclase (GGDEF)-like protein
MTPRGIERPGAVTADVALPIHALEPNAIAAGTQAACLEILGPCHVRIFSFADKGRERVSALGEEGEAKTYAAPALESAGVWGPDVQPLDGNDADSRAPWCALLPLRSGDETVGFLQVAAERALDGQRLQEVVRSLSVAVGNAQIFEKTKQLTFTDDLTALYNARFMSLYLERELKRCRRTRSPLSLLFMDLDGFKAINDTHGHLAGSRTLVEVGAVLEKTVRDADVLIRYGGDEFVILFPETPLSGGLIIAERLRVVIGATKFLESQQIEARVSASIGLAAYPETADDVRGLIASADRAMYEAKALGKNRVVAAPPFRSSETISRGPSH